MSAVSVQGRPSAGTVMGAIGMVAGIVALAISLSGIADAAGHHNSRHLVKRGEIAPGAVTAKNLANGAVHASALARSSVTSPKLANESVNRRVLKKESVTATAIAPDSVTSAAVAPGSIHGYDLTAPTIHSTPIADVDQVAENGMWTASNTEVAMCGANEPVLGGGFSFSEPGNREVGFLQASPFTSGTGNGVAGRITSNSGGVAKAQVIAVCLP